MKVLIFITSVLISPMLLSGNSYWQQKANYHIKVSLDDQHHFLRGWEKISYFNRSPDTLDTLYFHLWPNAYRNKETPLAKQGELSGNLSLHRLAPNERGFIDSLDFRHQGKKLKYIYQNPSVEICKVILLSPLLPGVSITITTPFKIKIPKNISRLGHRGQSYQITQWYPKIALYDQDGWHTMPYLDQGEFYNDFGSYHVEITAPKNYVIAGGGNLQTQSEKKWLAKLHRQTQEKIRNKTSGSGNKSIAKSASDNKTVVYRQKNVIDFAWFASKDFDVLIDTFLIPGGKKITSYSFFNSDRNGEFQNTPEYLRQAVRYYSKKLGAYPYRHISVVAGPMGSGGGMEYPTITIISSALPERTIFHEIGHNWFQAILATNERAHPWMDEGINTFYENRFFKKQMNTTLIPDTGLASAENLFLNFRDFGSDPFNYLTWHIDQLAMDQPPGLHSTKFTPFNYGIMVYGKTSQYFNYLFHYLGETSFDSAMSIYYQRWKFKHPGPGDIKQILEEITGENLDWFFDYLIDQGKSIDYSVKKAPSDPNSPYKKVLIENHGQTSSPVLLYMIKNDMIIKVRKIKGFRGKNVISLDTFDFSRIIINPRMVVPEKNLNNNILYSSNFKNLIHPLQVRFLTGFNKPGYNQIFLSPTLGYNVADGFMLGGFASNSMFPPQKLEWAILPIYGFGSGQLTGTGKVSMNWYFQNRKNRKSFHAGIKGKTFNYRTTPKVLNYNKIEPFISYTFQSKPFATTPQHAFKLRTTLVNRDELSAIGNKEKGNYREIKSATQYYLNEFRYQYEQNKTYIPAELNFTIHQNNRFAKIFSGLKFHFPYRWKNQGLWLRVFGGKFLYSNKNLGGEYYFRFGNQLRRFTTNLSTPRDFQDYQYDEVLFDRGANNNFFSQQVYENNGNFKIASSIGITNNWLIAINFMSSLPGRLPIKVFADIGSSANNAFSQGISYDAGIALVLIKDFFEIYYPLPALFSNDFKSYIQTNNIPWYNLLQFQLDLKKLNFLKIRKEPNKIPFF